MYNAYAMAMTAENKRESQQAFLITMLFSAGMLLLMFLIKWDLPVFEKNNEMPGIEVELTLPPEPEISTDGGGGGGNPVHAAGFSGIASAVPPTPGEMKDSKDAETENDKENAVINKPDIAKPKATSLTNTSVVKTTAKPITETPAPPKPKATMGRTMTGSGRGGGADDYEKSGGAGSGYGVGTGNGTGGGKGNGIGGGTGTGGGTGSGPKVTRGDRKIIRYYSFEGDLDKAVVYANISVSPDGIGRFINIAKGSSNTSNAYKQAIMKYLQNIKFDKADHESMLTVQFNFRVD